MPGFTPQQCIYRWKKHLKTGISKGRWKPEEDKHLIISVAFNGTIWSRVAETVPTKTDVQCRERWINVLTPEIKSEPWSREEDELLMKAVETIGVGKWAKVSKELPGRTDNSCWRRWKKINRVRNSDIPDENYENSLYPMETMLPSSNAGYKESSDPTMGGTDTVVVEKVAAQNRNIGAENSQLNQGEGSEGGPHPSPSASPSSKSKSKGKRKPPSTDELKSPPRKRGRPEKQITYTTPFPEFTPFNISPTIGAQLSKFRNETLKHSLEKDTDKN